MNQLVPILALICLSSPSLGRNWAGPYDQNDNGFGPYHSDHHNYRPYEDSDYDSNNEEFWDRDDDFTDNLEHPKYPDHDDYNHHHDFNHHDDEFNYHDHKNPTFNHHNHENHRFDVRNHENSGYGHHHHENHPFDHNDNPTFDHHDNDHIPNRHGQGRVNDNDEHDQRGKNNGASDRPQNSHVDINEANGRERDDGKVGSPFDSLNSGSHNTGLSNPDSKDSGSPAPVDLRTINTEQGSVIDADRVVFPDNTRAPITSSPLGSSSHAQGVSSLAPTSPSLEHSTLRPIPKTPDQSTLSPTLQGTSLTPTPETKAPVVAQNLPLLDVVKCVRACRTTSEYNPVCGSNNITYNNPSILECTRNCGVNVSLARQAPCPRPIPLPLLQLLMESNNATNNLNTTTSVNTVAPLTSDPSTAAPE